ncbi:MAG TPA: HEAT repeat domain-containing protein, partial [bacterium]|nr:HEAT repeat domain-containing protein [bacterium]
ALNDKEWTVRSSAAEALGKIKDTRAIDPLIKVLADKDIAVRLSVIEALGEIGDKKAIEPLKKVASNDSSPIVKEKAKEILNLLQR